jgi:CHASE2 domain-containing sensor protein
MQHTRPNRVFALIVGITHYSDNLFSDIPTASPQAIEFYRWLRSQEVPIENIDLFLSPKPNDITEVNKQLEEISRTSENTHEDSRECKISTGKNVYKIFQRVKKLTHENVEILIKNVRRNTDKVCKISGIYKTPTSEKICEVLGKIKESDYDLLYVFWSGHGDVTLADDGSSKRHLYCCDASSSSLLNIDFTTTSFVLQKAKGKNRKQVYFIDSCANIEESTFTAVDISAGCKCLRNSSKYIDDRREKYDQIMFFGAREQSSSFGELSKKIIEELKKQERIYPFFGDLARNITNEGIRFDPQISLSNHELGNTIYDLGEAQRILDEIDTKERKREERVEHVRKKSFWPLLLIPLISTIAIVLPIIAIPGFWQGLDLKIFDMMMKSSMIFKESQDKDIVLIEIDRDDISQSFLESPEENKKKSRKSPTSLSNKKMLQLLTTLEKGNPQKILLLPLRGELTTLDSNQVKISELVNEEKNIITVFGGGDKREKNLKEPLDKVDCEYKRVLNFRYDLKEEKVVRKNKLYFNPKDYESLQRNKSCSNNIFESVAYTAASSYLKGKNFNIRLEEVQIYEKSYAGYRKSPVVNETIINFRRNSNAFATTTALRFLANPVDISGKIVIIGYNKEIPSTSVKTSLGEMSSPLFIAHGISEIKNHFIERRKLIRDCKFGDIIFVIIFMMIYVVLALGFVYSISMHAGVKEESWKFLASTITFSIVSLIIAYSCCTIALVASGVWLSSFSVVAGSSIISSIILSLKVYLIVNNSSAQTRDSQ